MRQEQRESLDNLSQQILDELSQDLQKSMGKQEQAPPDTQQQTPAQEQQTTTPPAPTTTQEITDQQEPVQKSVTESEFEKNFTLAHKALELVSNIFKSKGKEEEEGEDEETQGGEQEEMQGDNVEKSLEIDYDENEGVVDAGPILKSLDSNFKQVAKSMKNMERVLESLTKAQAAQLAIGKASIAMEKAINASVGTLTTGISEIYTIKQPFQSQAIAKDQFQLLHGGEAQKAGFDFGALYNSDPKEYRSWANAINKAVMDNKIDHNNGLAMAEDKFIPQDALEIIKSCKQ